MKEEGARERQSNGNEQEMTQRLSEKESCSCWLSYA